MNAPVSFDLAKAEPVAAPQALSGFDRHQARAADYELWFALAADRRWSLMGLAATIFVWACVIGTVLAIIAAVAPF